MKHGETPSQLPPGVANLLDRQYALESELVQCTAALREALHSTGTGQDGSGPGAAAAADDGWIRPMLEVLRYDAGESDVTQALIDAVQFVLPDSAGAVSVISDEDAPAIIGAWDGAKRWTRPAEGTGHADDHGLLERLTQRTSERAVRIVLSGLGLTVGELRLWPEGADRDHVDRIALPRIESIAGVAGLALAGMTVRRRLRQRSVRDALTGLFNHRYLEDTLARELHRARRNASAVSLLMIDIDDFAAFCKQHGVDAGDMVLEAYAGMLQSSFRGSDVCSRWEASRLGVLLPEADLEDSIRRASAVRTLLSQLEIRHRGRILTTPGVSVGVAAYPVHADTADALIAAAERALRHAVESGGDMVVGAERAH